MLEDKIIAFTKFISKLILLVITLIFIFGFAFALSEKIKRPNYKNLSDDDFITLGLIIIVLVVLNLFVFGIIFKKAENN